MACTLAASVVVGCAGVSRHDEEPSATDPRRPSFTLHGPPHRDLGEVPISGEAVRVEWVGVYSGSSGDPETAALTVTATCGCTQLSVSPDRPRNGDRVSVAADVSLSRRGSLTSTIHLVENGDVIAVLSVAAVVTAPHSLTIARVDARREEVELLLLWRGGEPPDAVVVERDRADAERIAIAPTAWHRVGAGMVEGADADREAIWRAHVSVPWPGRRGFDPVVTVHAGLVSASRHIQ